MSSCRTHSKCLTREKVFCSMFSRSHKNCEMRSQIILTLLHCSTLTRKQTLTCLSHLSFPPCGSLDKLRSEELQNHCKIFLHCKVFLEIIFLYVHIQNTEKIKKDLSERRSDNLYCCWLLKPHPLYLLYCTGEETKRLSSEL